VFEIVNLKKRKDLFWLIDLEVSAHGQLTPLLLELCKENKQQWECVVEQSCLPLWCLEIENKETGVISFPLRAYYK
jgi:hypothetical protein